MSLRNRLLAYLLFNAAILVAVVIIGAHILHGVQGTVLERVQLDRERQGIRNLCEFGLEQANLTDDLLLDPTEEDLARSTRLLELRRLEDASLEEAQPSLSTLKRLLELRSQQRKYEVLLGDLVRRRPSRTLAELRAATRLLREETESQFRVLRAMDEDVHRRLANNQVALQQTMSSQWTLLAALCLSPFLACLALLGSFTNKLTRGVLVLDAGFRRLGDGDFAVRLTPMLPSRGAPGEIASILHCFDRTAEELERLAEVRTRFHSMAIHDLRSPLSTMLLAVSALRDPRKTEANRLVYVDLLERRLRVVLKLVTSFLDGLLLESGKVQIYRRPIDLEELVGLCVADLRSQAMERDQQLIVEGTQDFTTISCDPAEVEQVLANLIGNAIKYSRAGDTIRISVTEPHKGEVQFMVEDHGPGISDADQRRIFEAFQRAGATSCGTDGRGLGLAICKQLVEAHGGKLWVESKPGAGSRFFFVIPEAKAPAG
ncbi:MAG: HAMP domain-containing histidine kinase [Candidatus Riflebacteria bacterium]|nr:HAMP domain-containing histidine kinase [Candidatus Riflebacteria bacterium]